MFNTMNTIRPRQYPQANGNYKANNGGTDKDGHNQNAQDQREQQQQQGNQVIARGTVQEVQNQTPVGTRQAIYSPAQNAYAQTTPMQSYQVNTPPPIRRTSPIQINPMQYQAMQAGYQPLPQPMNQTQYTNQPSVSSFRNNKVNIAQIIKDFRNTIKAIATPAEIEEQVNRYLVTVEEQVKSERPQVNLIQSNLKIAASLLDKYISETLNKESKVVQNWLDALFLQKIDYSYNEADINPNFLVKFPNQEENKTQETEEIQPEVSQQETNIQPEVSHVSEVQKVQEVEQDDLNLEEEFSQAEQVISQKPNITIIPQDTRLKSLFVEAKKQAFSNNPQKAMAIFKEAFSAEELELWHDLPLAGELSEENAKVTDEDIDKEKVRNWYSDYSELTPSHAVFLCQRENLRWDKNLRLCILLGVLLCLFACICVWTVKVWNLRVCEALPVLIAGAGVSSVLIKIIVGLALDIVRMGHISTVANVVEANLQRGVNSTPLLIQLQNLIYDNRCNVVLVPDFIYKILRKSWQKYEDDIADAHVEIERNDGASC